MSRRWLTRHRRDQYYRLAKRRGLRSRAAYKLLQIARSHKLIEPGDRVLDLGTAPGGWLQIARDLAGETGFVLGVDLQEIEPLPYKNVLTIVADITKPSASSMILEHVGGLVDVVLSDVSPKVSGVWEVDQARQIHLATQSLDLARTILKPKGFFLVKAFHSPDLKNLIEEMKRFFSEVKIVKPKASRPESSEVYVLGLFKKPTT